MELLTAFLHAFWGYVLEIWWVLLIGFGLSGMIANMIPPSVIQKHLGQEGLKPILLASTVGVILPVCCIGSLPIAVTFRRQGASLGAVLAFLVATPATSLSALFVCWRLLGPVFTLGIFVSAIIIALVIGIISSGIHVDSSEKSHLDHSCCGNEPELSRSWKNALKYGLVTLPKDMGHEIIIGLAIASFITVYPPIQNLIETYVTGLAGYGIILITGLLTYVCSTASVPMADALLQSGVSSGQALTYLLVGPITSLSTILVINKTFGRHVVILYLVTICSLSLILGITFDFMKGF